MISLSLCTRADASSQPNASSRPALRTLCQKRGVHDSTSRHGEELGVPVGADVLERHAEEGVSWLVLRLLRDLRVSLNLKVSVFKNAWISRIGSFNYRSSTVTEKYLLKTVSFVPVLQVALARR